MVQAVMEVRDGVATVSGGLRLTFAMTHERVRSMTGVRTLCVSIIERSIDAAPR